MAARVRDHQLHRHGEVERVVAGGEGAARVGVPQPVAPGGQPRPGRPAAEPEDPRVRRGPRALLPARRTAGRSRAADPDRAADPGRIPDSGRAPGPRRARRPLRVPPARRPLRPQQQTAGRTELHPAVAQHHDGDPLGHHPPAVRVRFEHGPGIGLGTTPGQRVRRLGLGTVPAAEDRAAHGDPHPQHRPREPDRAAARRRLRAQRRPRHPGPLPAAPGQVPRVDAPPPQRGAHREPPARGARHPHRPQQPLGVRALPPQRRTRPPPSAVGPRPHLVLTVHAHTLPPVPGAPPPVQPVFTWRGAERGEHPPRRAPGDPPWRPRRSHGIVLPSP